MTKQSPHQSNWADDVMGRQRYADFLTQYVSKRVGETDQPLTIALDASWGAGKTFFVERWAKDIEERKGGVITFDAWKNDFSVDVLVSFMAELSDGLKKLRSRISSKGKVANTLKEQSNSVLAGFRKAAMPAATVIAKGVISKVTGVAIEQISEAISANDSKSIGSLDWDKLSENAGGAFEQGLEKFFEKTLEAHKARSKAAEGFVSSLELLVATLQSEKVMDGPLYIFVDELDRCRPDYAIKLLEGIKHLFAVKGVVFVISTNLDQLSKSTQAVYGGRFDGHGYLKRFFDIEFTLPPPDTYSFARVLIADASLFTGKRIDSGLNEQAYEQGDNLLAKTFELVADAIELQLRAQKQVWTIANAASVGIPNLSKISVIWLFFLAALRHAHPVIFEKLGGIELGSSDFKTLCSEIGKVQHSTVDSFRVIRGDGYGQRRERSKVPLIDILYTYYQASHSTLEQISKRFQNGYPDYPGNLSYQLIEERPSPYNSSVAYEPKLKDYHQLVKMAGLLTS